MAQKGQKQEGMSWSMCCVCMTSPLVSVLFVPYFFTIFVEKFISFLVYVILMLRLYNCTGIYIVKYRQSIAFHNIYISDHFLGSCEGEKRQKTSECCTGRRLLSFWTSRCVHWMTTSVLSTLLPWTTVILEKRARIICSVCSYNLRSTAKNNRQDYRQTWWGIKHLF